MNTMSGFSLLVLLVPLVQCFGAALAVGVPNVLLIVVDDLRPEIAAYGFNQSSPYIANFAKTSTLFKSAYCQFSICSPSRASFLTGLRPASTQIYDLTTYFRNIPGLQNVVTLPQFFKNQGYRVAGGGKIFHPGTASGNDDDAVSWTEPYFHATNERRFGSKTLSWEARTDPELDFPDAEIATNTIAQLRSLKNDKFFIAMGLHKPHLPFVFPSSYLDRYPMADDIPLANTTSPPATLPAVAWSGYTELKAYGDITALNLRTNRPGNVMPVSKARELRRAYWAASSFADNQVGRVLQELDNLGLRQNTTVVVMSDHGWQLGDLGEWSKSTNFESSNRVVLMIRDPSRPLSAGRTVNTNVELVDVYPTLVDLANFTAPSVLEGKSLLPLLRSPFRHPADWANVSFSQVLKASGQYATSGPFMGYTIRSKDWRYTEWVKFNLTSNTPDWLSVNGIELYDHRGDSHDSFGYYERENLASDSRYGDVRIVLSAMLQSQMVVRPVTTPTNLPQSQSAAPTPKSTGSSAAQAYATQAFVLNLALASSLFALFWV